MAADELLTVGKGRGRAVAEEHAFYLGLYSVKRGSLRGEVFEGLSRSFRGDALACSGHHTCLIITMLI